jgi:toxin FitB
VFLLDTNVVSELRRKHRNPDVVEWVRSVPPDSLYLSVITIGEIAKGIAKLRRSGAKPAQRDADALQAWLDGLLAEYADRILPVTVPIATRWGRLCDAHPEVATDMLLAATALDAGLVVATRNVEHFRGEVSVVNPFVAS